MIETQPGVYVLDTHALFWFWTNPRRLGQAAVAVFDMLEAGTAVGLVPLLVVAELHYLTAKLRRQLTVEELLERIDASRSLRLEPITRNDLVAFGQLVSVPEMHDRFIAAVALLYNAPLVTRDAALHRQHQVRVIW